MTEEFNEWWQHYNNTNTTCMDDLQVAMEYSHKEEGKMKHGEKFEKWMLSQCKECAYELVSDFEHVAEHCSECKLRFKAAFNAGAAAMREKAAEVAEVADNKDMFSGDRLDRLAKEIANDIRRIEVES